MSDRDNQNNNKPDYQKIDKLLQEIGNKTGEDKQIIIQEINREISNQLTDESKRELFYYIIKSTVEHHDKVFEPIQKFVYPDLSIEKTNKLARSIQLKTFQFDTVTLQSDGKIINTRKRSHYFTEDLGDGILLEMVYIPAGSFLMGVSQTEIEQNQIYSGNEQPQHLVNIPAFFLGKFSVTQEQWKAIMVHNLSAHQGENAPTNLPVETTSWLDATEFCHRLSLQTGRNYRLPSEAEWEYACRAGTTTLYNFGDKINTDLANYWNLGGIDDNDTIVLETKPVGSYYPNPFGLYDLHGNVYELCQDAWHNNYEGAPTDGSAWGNGGDKGLVVIRGGSFDYYEYDCYSACRSETTSNYRYHGTGFRVACSLESMNQ